MSQAQAVTDATFTDEVLMSDKPVLVDYWADWCAPCRQLSPLVDELAAEHGDKIKVVKMDTSANTETPITNGIMSLPTLQIFQGGKMVKQSPGARNKAALLKFVGDFL